MASVREDGIYSIEKETYNIFLHPSYHKKETLFIIRINIFLNCYDKNKSYLILTLHPAQIIKMQLTANFKSVFVQFTAIFFKKTEMKLLLEYIYSQNPKNLNSQHPKDRIQNNHKMHFPYRRI